MANSNLYNVAVEEMHTLENNIHSLINEIKTLPEGSLSLKKIKGRPYYYHDTLVNGKRVQNYISKDNSQIIDDLKRKKFYQATIAEKKERLKHIKSFLNKCKEVHCSEILDNLPPAYKNAPMNSINRVFPLHDWNNQPYQTNPHHPEHLIHTTSHGLKVRSKSEVIIADRLTANRIPFRYEALLILESKNIYPDFTILSPRDHRVYYWEHFGLTNNSDYMVSKDKRIELFNANNITPWTNLITSYDDTNGSISGLTIQNLINAFLL